MELINNSTNNYTNKFDKQLNLAKTLIVSIINKSNHKNYEFMLKLL